MPCALRTFYDLPDELVLDIVLHFRIVHSYETQSTAFKDKRKEIARQRENRSRQVTLNTLSQTCRRLRQIATPRLYASYVGAATSDGYVRLKLFHRTISSPRNTFGLNDRLAAHITSIENRLADHRGHDLYGDMESCSTLPSNYFYLLSKIVYYAKNLRHVSVVSLETDEVSLWNYILPDELSTWKSPTSIKEAPNQFKNIRTLSFQVHTRSSSTYGLEAAWFRRICSAISPLSTLVDLRASGIESSGLSIPRYECFKNLQRLEITECGLRFDEVVDVWSSCEGSGLRHIVCEWAYLDANNDRPSKLYPGLLLHQRTLETLVLDLREVRFDDSFAHEGQHPVGMLGSFAQLRSVAISEAALLGHSLPLLDFPTASQRYRIAEILPKNLCTLVILLSSIYGHDIDRYFDQVVSIWQMVGDLSEYLPELRIMTFKSESSGPQLIAPELKKAFANAGVLLDMQTKWPPTRFE